MEVWQRDHIRANLPQLLRDTACSSIFLSRLYADGLLAEEEIDILGNIKNNSERAKTFFDFIQTRCGSYNLLKQALQDTSQTGAYAILAKCNEHSGSTPYRNCGTISYDKNEVLGQGSFSTTVVKGKFENRIVAVKIMNIQYIKLGVALKEVEFYSKLDWHVNLVRYFKAEVTEDHVLIALELCDTNLHDWVLNKKKTKEKRIEMEVLDILKQMTKGLEHLHSHRLVHRDLKPANILIMSPAVGKARVKIADFGMSRNIPDGNTRLSVHSSGVGTEGWMAPEVVAQMDEEEPTNGVLGMSLASDIFSLGCIYYFVLTEGIHPFGSPARRQGNILDGKYDLSKEKIKTIKTSGRLGLIWLIRQMIAQEDKQRPSVTAILSHHVFWSSQKIFSFLKDISPYVEGCAGMLDESCNLVAEHSCQNWISLTCPVIQEFLKAEKNLDASKFSSLVQVFIGLEMCYWNLPKTVRNELGASSEEFLSYWESRFPHLLPLVWTCFQHVKDKKDVIKKYYHDGGNKKGIRFCLVSEHKKKKRKLILHSVPVDKVPKILVERLWAGLALWSPHILGTKQPGVLVNPSDCEEDIEIKSASLSPGPMTARSFVEYIKPNVTSTASQQVKSSDNDNDAADKKQQHAPYSSQRLDSVTLNDANRQVQSTSKKEDQMSGDSFPPIEFEDNTDFSTPPIIQTETASSIVDVELETAETPQTEITISTTNIPVMDYPQQQTLTEKALKVEPFTIKRIIRYRDDGGYNKEGSLEGQKRTYKIWMNSFLVQANLEVTDIFKDLRDGIKLLKFLEILSGQTLFKPTRGRMRIHSLENVEKALGFLHHDLGVGLLRIGANDIVDGNPKLTLALLWIIMLTFQNQQIEKQDDVSENRGNMFRREELLQWCQNKTAGYANVKISDFKESWRNGLGFNALIHAYRPELIKFQKLDPAKPISNLNNAFYVAEDFLEIPNLLMTNDVADGKYDEQSIITYITMYYHKLAL